MKVSVKYSNIIHSAHSRNLNMVKKDSDIVNLIERSKAIGIICGPGGDATVSSSIAMSAYIDRGSLW